MKVSADVRAMIERRKKGHTLEAPFYTSEEIHALDMDAIFRKHWIHVAVEPDVPEPGDFMTVEVGNDSVLIVRDDDMQIRAFHNVCRHRGARLCSSDKGSLGKYRVSVSQLDLQSRRRPDVRRTHGRSIRPMQA